MSCNVVYQMSSMFSTKLQLSHFRRGDPETSRNSAQQQSSPPAHSLIALPSLLRPGMFQAKWLQNLRRSQTSTVAPLKATFGHGFSRQRQLEAPTGRIVIIGKQNYGRSPFILLDYNNCPRRKRMFNGNSYTLPLEEAPSSLGGSFTHLLSAAGGQSDSTREMLQVINAQNLLIMKLLHKQNILYQDLQQTRNGSDSSEFCPQRLPSTAKSFHTQHLLVPPFFDGKSSSESPLSEPQGKVAPSALKTPGFRSKPQRKVVFDAEVHSEEGEGEEGQAKRRQPESKNMIKNFAKGIFKFIRKQAEWRNRVLETVGVAEAEFMRAYSELRGRIHSICDLRALWTDSSPLGSAFRVLSFEYLRRHYLRKVFNSRIENQALHLKYRRRLLEALGRPEDFTALKTS